MARRLDSRLFEAALATLSMAGIRPLVSTNISVNASAENTYTIVNKSTRRLMAVHISAAAGDIRIAFDATASATSLPLVPQRYFVWDAEAGQVFHAFNTSAGAIVVYLVEIE